MDREHIVDIAPADVPRLREWLKAPSGAFTAGQRFSFSSVENGGLMARTWSYGSEYSPLGEPEWGALLAWPVTPDSEYDCCESPSMRCCATVRKQPIRKDGLEYDAPCGSYIGCPSTPGELIAMVRQHIMTVRHGRPVTTCPVCGADILDSGYDDAPEHWRHDIPTDEQRKTHEA